MATRDDHGRITTPERFASPEFRALALALQRAGSSIRAIAAETGRSKTALARDLRVAREEEAEAREAEKAARLARQPEPERKPGASVLVLDAVGRLTRPDGSIVASKSFTLPKRRYTEGQLSVMESNERAALTRQAYVRAGLSATGFATYETSIGRGSYDPADPADVERVRDIICDDAIRAGASEADAAAEADAWQPHPGLR